MLENPVEGEELDQTIPLELYLIVTLPALEPTATHLDPLNATPRPSPANIPSPCGEDDGVSHVNPS
jgi:hypothetical protein